MPFTCALCSLEIAAGEAMVSDPSMNLAHESCIRKVMTAEKATAVAPHVTILSPKLGAPLPAAADLCVPTKLSKTCSECGKPCIAMCPAPCLSYVHQDYGYSGDNCSGRHEGKCETARKSREPVRDHKREIFIPDQRVQVIDVIIGPATTKTRKRKTTKAKRKKARR